MIYALFGYWVVGMATAVALGFGAGWGGVGIWSGLAAGLTAVALLMLVRWSRRERLGLVAP
jgi:MATE family multidrug resistance protein